MPTGPTFSVLGALEVHRDGAAVRLPGLRLRAVLAALLVQAGHRVSADALVEAAWGGMLPDNPRASLHTVISRLRAALGGDVVRRDAAGYRLDVAPESLDAVRFEKLYGAARDAPASRAAGALAEALDLWRGPAYAQFADRDFAAAEAVRLEELRLSCIEDLAELRLSTGDVATAAATLEAFTAEYPLRERARGLLMTALYQSGRVNEALDTYHEYRDLLVHELGLDPSPALCDLHERILSHRVEALGAGRHVAKTGTNMGLGPPADATNWLATDAAFLGRDDEAAALADLAVGNRMVTVTGPGGVGKTRLVAETLPVIADRLGLPVAVVELAGTDEKGVETAAAAALGVSPASGAAKDALLDYLSLVPVLLVLDNCEHVLANVQRFVEVVLRRCPGVKVLATSRQRIDVNAEHLLPLEPLLVPGEDSTTAELAAALRLFSDRARRVRPGFAMTDADVPAVAEICRRLDGLPLAIELAATRAATLGIEPLLQRLDTGLDLLGDSSGSGERTLRMALDWSYGLLDRDDRALFAALAVFHADFDIDQAEQVAAGLVARPVAVGMGRLAEASLVAVRTTGGAVRYRMLEIVRAFARDCLAGSGLEDEVRLAHARWARSVADAAAAQAVGPGLAMPEAMSTDAGGIRAAATWALCHGHADLAAEISGGIMLATVHWRQRFDLIDTVRLVGESREIEAMDAAPLARAAAAFAAIWQGDLAVGQRLARAALAGTHSVDQRYLALCALGVGTIYSGNYDRSRYWWRELLGTAGLPPARHVDGHASLALIDCYEGRFETAREHAAKAVALAEATESPAYRAFASYATAEVSAAADYGAGMPLLEKAVHEMDHAGVEFAGGLAATALSAALTRLGRTADAAELLGPLLERWLRLAAWPQLWTTMRVLAEVLARCARPEDAALLLTAAEQAPSAPAIAGTDVERYARLNDELRQRVDPAAHQKIATLAAYLPRTAVVDRARGALTALREQSPSQVVREAR